MLRRKILLAALVLVPATAAAEDFTGKVVRIVDGDSLVVLRGREQIDVRLEGIDSPELGQAFGRRVQKATASWLLANR